MAEPKSFKTVISKLLNAPSEDWTIQVKNDSDLSLRSSCVDTLGNVQEIAVEYKVQHQAKFLLKSQQKPTLHWFPSQDGIDKLLETSHISNKPEEPAKQDAFLAEDTRDLENKEVNNDNGSLSSVNKSLSAPQVNLKVVKRTDSQGSKSLSSLQTEPLSSTAESPAQDTFTFNCDISDIPEPPQKPCSGESQIENADPDSQTGGGNIDSEMGKSDPVRPSSSQECCDENLTAQDSTDGVRTDVVCSKSKPKEFGGEDTALSGPSLDCEVQTVTPGSGAQCEPCVVRSAPILPSEQSVIKTDDDVVLNVEGVKLPVSKLLLSLHSEFFKAMFTSDMKESQQEEIELPALKHCILQQILHFCETGELTVNGDTVHHLLHTAHQFQMAPVIEMCEHFLIRITRQDVLLELLDIADHYLLVRLLKSCFKLIGEQFQQMHIQGILKQLKYDHLLALLESDIFVPDASEFQIFRAVVEWVEKDVSRNAQHLDTFLDLIKFPLMHTSELSQINKLTEPWLTENDTFQKQLKFAFKYKNCIHEQPLMSGYHSLPRGAVKTLTMIVEDDSILSEANALECHLVPVGESARISADAFITHKLKLEWLRDGYAVAALHNFMYIGGGYNPSEDRNLSSVHRYNPATGKWVSVQAMRHRRAAFVLCALGNDLYAIGGRQFDSHLHAAFGLRAKTLNSVERYDCTKDSWSKVANLQVGLFAHAGASCNGALYVSGGRTDDPAGMEDTNALVAYQEDADAWTPCPAMTHHRYYHGMVAVQQKLYVAGGVNYNPSDAYGVWNFITEPECYDTETRQWTALALMPHRRSQVAVTAVHRTLYVIGGLPHPGVDGKREVLEYSIARDEWQPSKLKYPAFWPTQCCTLYFPRSTLDHASRVSDFDRDKRHLAGREVLYSLSRIPHT